MRFAVSMLLLATTAACQTPLTDAPAAAGPDASVAADAPAWPASDCSMFNPTACRLDLAKTSVAIDVNYPNLVFCRLQLLPSRDLFNTAAWAQLAAGWQVTFGYAPANATVLAPETPHAVLEYPLGTEQFYVARATFASKTGDTIAALVANTLGADVSLYAVPIACPGR